MIEIDKNIIFEDKDMIVLNKPYGLLSQMDKQENKENVVNLLEKYLSLNSSEHKEIHIINRLDRGVSGLLLLAKNKNSADILTKNLQDKTQSNFEKKYLAIVYGKSEPSKTLKDFIMKNQRLNISKIVNKNSTNSKEAILNYKTIKTIEKQNTIISLLQVTLITGRHHQIRLQLSNAGLPIVGDKKYNKERQKLVFRDGICLFSNYLSFNHPKTSKTMNFEISPDNLEIFRDFF